jgi:UPF0716 protein FxsA
MVKWIIVAILLLPVAEIVVFALVAAIIGLLWAILLMIATSAMGFFVLRRAGRARLAGFRVAVADSDITAIEANTGGFLTVLAGLLLLLPGFLTDLVGALLLIRPLRRRCGAAFRQAARRRDRGRNAVIDLAPSEWQQVQDRELEHKHKREREQRDKPGRR